jgi:hypothetical protein
VGDIADWDTDRLYDTPDDFQVSDESYELPYIRIERETKKAWMVLFEEEPPVYRLFCWLPKSECSISKSSKIISVPYWLIKENDLEELL